MIARDTLDLNDTQDLMVSDVLFYSNRCFSIIFTNNLIEKSQRVQLRPIMNETTAVLHRDNHLQPPESGVSEEGGDEEQYYVGGRR
jgi:predicted transposase YbfD/YdcC